MFKSKKDLGSITIFGLNNQDGVSLCTVFFGFIFLKQEQTGLSTYLPGVVVSIQ